MLCIHVFLDYGLLKYILFYCGFWVAKYLVVVFLVVCVLFLQLLLFLSGTGVEVVCKFLPRNVPIPVPQITLTKNELLDRG